ncbi:MAG: N-acetyltransferase [Actinobacteria bacterium]|jgi:RimJ/RimL family protein N-acetyltransferase|nr:N-acetyltransferase [Actinomycetota bacterium]NBP91089.1 N-acetyltransferase [Actinomycetota bacterium]
MHFADDFLIESERLSIFAVNPNEYRKLAIDRADPTLWVDRNVTNPHRYLVEQAGPLPFRIPRVAKNPSLVPYLLRMAILRSSRVIIGSAGFHDGPDENGMIEIGLEIVEEHRGQGLAQELLFAMWDWVVHDSRVKILRYTVSPENAPSQAIIKKFEFAYVGQQIDEEDGPEDIYEMSVANYRRLRAI